MGILLGILHGEEVLKVQGFKTHIIHCKSEHCICGFFAMNRRNLQPPGSYHVQAASTICVPLFVSSLCRAVHVLGAWSVSCDFGVIVICMLYRLLRVMSCYFDTLDAVNTASVIITFHRSRLVRLINCNAGYKLYSG